MPLYLADVRLHRARFSLAQNNRDQAAAELAEARRLIEKHHYGRRLQELDDAEAVLHHRSPINLKDSAMSFDVFLSYNSHNRDAAIELKQKLTDDYQLSVWYDRDELQPGIAHQPLLEEAIHQAKSAAVLFGADGIGPWENVEMQAALRLAVEDGRPVIPVLLPGVPQKPNLPLFLGNNTWVELQDGFTPENLDILVWGITGKKPNRGKTAAAPKPDPPQPKPPQPPAIDEFALLEELAGIPGPWFNQLVYQFDRNNAVPATAAQRDRALELMKVLRVVDPELHQVTKALQRLKEQ